MSISAVTSSTTYALNLYNTGKLQRSLTSLGSAVSGGNLSGATSTLKGIIAANPQFQSTSSTGGSSSADPINKGFNDLAAALDKGDVTAAQNAWSGLRAEFKTSDVSMDSAATTSKALAQLEQNSNSLILSSISKIDPVYKDETDLTTTLLGLSGSAGFNSTSVSTDLTQTLLGVNSASSSSSSVLQQWLTYDSKGSVAPVADKPTTPAAKLDEKA